MRNDWFEAFRLGLAEVALGRHFFIRGQNGNKITVGLRR
jgi:hypothetical protein